MLGIFLFISGQEIFIILLVVLLLFGANKKDFKELDDDIKKVKKDLKG